MKNMKDILNEIEEEVKFLTDVDDCFSIEIGNNKGLFIQVIDYGEGKEYFIELNDIDTDGAYEPCADYNESFEFGNIEGLKEAVKDYLERMIIK